MDLLVLAGFLGSGKTTLLLAMARDLVSRGNKVAILENEIGEIGVDGEYLRMEGLSVQELFGGCICCTLSSGLVSSLEKIQEIHSPDICLLEATGVARPGDIRGNVETYARSVSRMKTLTLVDLARFDVLLEVMTPLVSAQIREADMVVVNKKDMAGPGVREKALARIREINPRAHTLCLSAEKDPPLAPIWECLL